MNDRLQAILTAATLAMVCVLNCGSPALAQNRGGLLPIDIDETRRLGYVALEARDFEGAADQFGRVVSEDPDDSNAWYLLAHCFQEDGKFEKAIATFEEATRFPKLRAAAFYEMASIYAQQEDTEQALARLKQAVAAGYCENDLREDRRFVLLRDDKEFQDLALRALPPGKKEEYRQLDFWHGNWTIFAADSGEQLAESSMNGYSSNFMMMESWTTKDGETGCRIYYYNPRAREWTETVITTSFRSDASGRWQDGALKLTGERRDASGAKTPFVATVTPDGDVINYRAETVPAEGESPRELFAWQYRKKRATIE